MKLINLSIGLFAFVFIGWALYHLIMILIHGRVMIAEPNKYILILRLSLVV